MSGLEEQSKHFEILAKMPIGTPLIFHHRGRKYRAVFEGTDLYQGRPRLRVRTQNEKAGGLIHAIPPERALDVAIAESTLRSLPKNPSGREVKMPSAFLEAWLDGPVPAHFAMTSTLDCLIIGHKSQLAEEVVRSRFGARTQEGVTGGTLQDILRVRSFLPNGEAYHSDVFPTNSDRAPRVARSPSIVIFDGVRAFLRWRNRWEGADWVVVLDRTDPNLSPAADLLNQGYAVRSEGDAPSLERFEVPAGVELLAYWEVR